MIGSSKAVRRRRLAAGWIAAGFVALGGAPLAAQGKDSVTLCQTLEPTILDPSAGAAAAIREVTYANIFEGLVALDRSRSRSSSRTAT
jgi:peptide/nickel transport system substrate-binding protein